MKKLIIVMLVLMITVLSTSAYSVESTKQDIKLIHFERPISQSE